MKRFVWRLQRVLDIKTKEEQAKKVELLVLTEKLAETRGALLAQKRILEDIIDDLTAAAPGKRLGRQEFFLRHSVTIDEQIRNLKDKAKELEDRQKEKVSEVLTARRFKEGLDKLREEAKKQFFEKQEKLEQKELDEGATATFARKSLQSGKKRQQEQSKIVNLCQIR